MPFFDKSYQVMALPAAVAAHLTSSIDDGEICLVIKKNALYIVAHDSLALVYLIEPGPNSLSRVRLVVNDATSVKQIFQNTNIREAWLNLLASPPPAGIDPDARGVIAQRVAELVNTFNSGADTNPIVPSTAIGSEPNKVTSPITEPQGSKPIASFVPPSRTGTEWPTTATPNMSSPKSSGITIAVVAAAVLVIGLVLVLSLGALWIRSQFNSVISALNTPLNLSGVNLNPDANWHPYDTSNIQECTQLAVAGFTCYTALQNTDDTVTVILGGVPSSLTNFDLAQVEKDSFTALQQRLAGISRVKVYNTKFSNQVDAIRREMIMPVRNTDLKHYGTQVYFHYKFTLFELTVEALSQEIYKAQLKNIDALINGITFSP